jgi:hypothetical protein
MRQHLTIDEFTFYMPVKPIVIDNIKGFSTNCGDLHWMIVLINDQPRKQRLARHLISPLEGDPFSLWCDLICWFVPWTVKSSGLQRVDHSNVHAIFNKTLAGKPDPRFAFLTQLIALCDRPLLRLTFDKLYSTGRTFGETSAAMEDIYS